MFERMVHLTSHEHFRRLSWFRQRNQPASSAPWFVVQEFTELSSNSQWLELEKREAEYWWREDWVGRGAH